MATIRIRDIPDEDAEVLRRRAEAAGMSLQAYVRQQLISLARRRTKAEVMAAVRQTLDRSPGAGADTLVAILREMRGE
jgi:antitoxin FitA